MMEKVSWRNNLCTITAIWSNVNYHAAIRSSKKSLKKPVETGV